MPSRSYATSTIQLGVETTYGTLVAGSKRVNDYRINPSIATETDPFFPSGATAPTLVVLNDESSTAEVEGRLSYTGIVYPLSSMFGAATITTPGGGTLSRLWTWTWDGTTAITPKSFSLEYGHSGAGNARTIAGFLFNALNFSLSRSGLDFGASGFGKPITTGATLTGSPTDIPAQPVFPLHVSIYADDTWVGLGTTKLLDTYTVDVDLGERTQRTMPLNAALTSDGFIEAEEQEHTVTLQMAADSVGDGFVSNLRNGTKKFIRAEAVGPIIETTIPYKLTCDFTLLFQSSDGYSSLDGVHGITWVGRVARDTTSGNALKIAVQNAQTAL